MLDTINVKTWKDLLQKDKIRRRNERQRANIIIQEVVLESGVSLAEITSGVRCQDVSVARSVLAYRLRNETDLSYPKIGDILNMDHTSVIYAVKRVEKELGK